MITRLRNEVRSIAPLYRPWARVIRNVARSDRKCAPTRARWVRRRLLAGGAIGIAFVLASPGAVLALTITGITITGPGTITKGTPATYTATISGTGTGTMNFKLSLVDSDPFDPDDDLVKEMGIAITALASPWTRTFTQTLFCNSDCEVAGANESSEEGDTAGDPAEVYFLLEGVFGGDVAASAKINVFCVMPAGGGGGVPEPSTALLFGAATVGVGLRRRASRTDPPVPTGPQRTRHRRPSVEPALAR